VGEKRLKKLPVIGITMGDPVGIGPEVIIKALAEGSLWESCVPVIFGDSSVIKAAMRVTGVSLPLKEVTNVTSLVSGERSAYVVPISRLDAEALVYGRPTVETGAAMVSYIFEAIRSAQSKEIDAVVTGPINKAAMALAGYSYPGHTELLAEKTGTRNYAMMLAGDKLKVVLVTIHQPLRSISALLTPEKIVSKISLTDKTMKDYFGLAEPKIAVAALNPHAGENGLFGDEEDVVIRPAILQAQREGIAAQGPFPADSLFYYACQGRYDAVICMYHDQGLIPLKLLHFDDAVNVTLGLPIVRTSVDHGTAYDIAGKGQAAPKSMINAIRLAVRMAIGGSRG